MPTVRVTIPQGDLSDEQTARFVERLTDAVQQFYLDETGEDLRDVVNVQIQETAENGYAVGGEIIG
ncbi:hypothetical protein BSZ35_17000 [Salinibacter sp. 10B]|uniref:tautomerase family protein n=1 Tax=Salinibacter sp. 10B TaxID=1923971 RepID=UPI000CF4D843|nr:tautomerase family protein [Salinibacter sp. 10B]PQJ36074.1 hypothetical protein BSZ35_17000 [Salinibacter sp. 10B]